MERSEFVHLHVHTEYSLLDGACRIKELISRAKELGQSAIAITDHGNMYGAAEFWKEAQKQGIKPIIGCEVYVAPRTRFDKEPRIDGKPYHLILLCENNEGYSNLVKLVSAGSLEGFYNKPRLDKELLRQYHGGLICLSACLAGEIPRLLVNGQYAEAKACALEYREIFGADNYFIEVQDHGIADERRILPQLYRLSTETGIPLAATNDCHYINKEDSEMQDVLLCIQTGKNLGEPNGMSFETKEFYLKTAEEMKALFVSRPEVITNTVSIAERCTVTFDFDSGIKLPKFQIEGVEDNDAYFREMCIKGMHRRYGENVPEKTEKRLEYELSVIAQLHFTDYFLIVWDFIRYARENGIPVGPGRGSGAGSLCAYCIGITGIDPMRYDLLFERFLNPERGNMPDFDIDFCIEGRQRVKDYVVQKYGADRVSEIIAFDTMKARAAVRDVGRVLGLPYQICDKAAKLIDPRLTLDQAMKESEELSQLYRNNRDVHRIIELARKIEGMPRHTSVHAAGVVISAVPLVDLVPLQRNEGSVVTQYTMTYLEELGLLKMDFLGLRNLTIIRDAVNGINRSGGSIDINRIPTDDPEVYRMLSRGDTAGVFQFESAGMTQRLMELVPERIEDLIVVLSLYRPGPMKSIPVYIENKRDPSKVKYLHPKLKEILEETYGVMVYQEQVMEICRKLAGYSYGHADEIRRAMAKKKQDVMIRERSSFVEGAAANGVPAETADRIFDEMVSFASYAFNKSHAAAYAYLSYQTAYLKCHYRGIYMSALMSSVMGNTAKLAEYISDSRAAGTAVVRPDINRSMKGFFYDSGKIYFGLLAIKNVGAGLAERIIAERESGGAYRSLQDFCERLQGRELNKKALENMIMAGAFDGLGLNRRQMIENYEMILDTVTNGSRGVIEGQLNFLDQAGAEDLDIKVTYRQEYDNRTLLNMEKEAAGMYLTGDPLSEYSYLGGLMHVTKAGQLTEEHGIKDGSAIRMLCIAESIREHITRSGDKMCFMVLADDTGETEAVMFPDLYAVVGRQIKPDSIVIVSGKASVKDDGVSVVCSYAAEESSFPQYIARQKLCIKADSGDSGVMSGIREVCGRYPGETEVIFYLTDQHKKVRPREKLTIRVCEESTEALGRVTEKSKIGLIS